MRSVDSLKNSITNTIGQILMTIIHFVVRMIFIRMLGDVYQSINGLFTNILSMLSLAELGLDFAICYSLYKPLAEKDTNKVNQYMSLYKSIYRIIGLVILGLGLILMPFLKLLVGEEYMVKEMSKKTFFVVVVTGSFRHSCTKLDVSKGAKLSFLEGRNAKIKIRMNCARQRKTWSACNF